MQRISVNLTNNRDGNQLKYKNNLLAISNKNYALQKPFESDFFTLIGSAKLRVELSDPFIKNENSVLPILIEKNFEQKFNFVS